MNYLGGKNRLAKKFAPILMEALAPPGGPNKLLIEPFMGGFNVVPALRAAGWDGVAECSDIHRGLVYLYRAVQAGRFVPPERISEEEWRRVRDLNDWSDPLTAMVAFGVSFSGMEWGAYARDANGTDYSARTGRVLARKAKTMQGVQFSHRHYLEVQPPPGLGWEYVVVYADPPYANTEEYASARNFDHAAFYEWCEGIARQGARVFVSEFTIPDRPGWSIVWQLERKVMMGKRRTVVDVLAEVKA